MKVWIYLPGSDTPVKVTEAQFDRAWKPRGFLRVEPDLAQAAHAGYVITAEEDLPAAYVAAVLADRLAADAEAPADSPAPKTKKTAASQAATPGEGDK